MAQEMTFVFSIKTTVTCKFNGESESVDVPVSVNAASKDAAVEALSLALSKLVESTVMVSLV